MEQKQRIEYIDFFKAVGIILMVMGHIGLGTLFSKLIYGFHMPMFFFASGFLFRKKSSSELTTSDYVLKKLKTLMLPYAIFGLLFGGIYWLINGFDKQSLINIFFYSTKGIPIAGALWFLPALFFADIIYFCIIRYVGNIWLKVLLFLIVALLGNLIPVTLPYALGTACVGVGMMSLGSLAKFLTVKYEAFKKIEISTGVIASIVVLVISVLLIFVNGEINMREGKYGVVPLFWSNALSICSVGLYLSYLWMKWNAFSKFNQVICSIGRKSIVFLCLNEAVISLTIKIRAILPLPAVISQVIILIITMIVLYIISKIVFITKLRVLFGK